VTKIGNSVATFGKSFALTMMFILMTNFAFAKVDVQAGVDRNEMGVGDSFTLTVSVTSDDSVDVNDPRVPDLKGFELLNSWRSSGTAQRLMQTPQGMQFLVTRTDEFSYLLAAKQKGTFTINSFEVVVSGKEYNTRPITISVGDRSAGPRPGMKRPSQQRRNLPGFGNVPDDVFDQLLDDENDPFSALLRRHMEEEQQGANLPRENRPEPQLRTLPTNHNEAFFIQVEVDKTDVYEGEQVTVSWYVYTRGQMESLDRLKFPDLKGFWKEIIEEVPSIQFTEEIVNGVPYRKALLASHALFPIKAGTAAIDEYKIKSRVRMPTEGFGGFSFGRAFEYTKSSQRVKINVKPLPVEGRPKDFSGAVGQFDIHSSVENQTVLAQQPFSLKLRFEGNGNAKLIELPAIEWPPGLEVYDTKSDAKFFKNGRSYKEFEILLIPRQTGELKIPAISFGMFDPQAKKYVSRSAAEIVLKVEENPNAAAGPSAAAPGAVSNHPAAPPVPTTKAPAPGTYLPGLMLTWEHSSLFSQAGTPAVAGGMYALALLLLIWKSKVELGWGRRRQTLRDIVNKRTKKLETSMQKNDYRRVGAEMTNIFNLVLGSISGQEASGLELERMLERISPSLRREYGDALRKQYEAFQIMSFAPEDMLGPYKQAATVRKEVDSAKVLLQKLINSNPENNEGQEA
jgi:hypothetical protein